MGSMMKLTIKNILKKTDGDQELFTWIYNRTIELFSSTYQSDEKIKNTIEGKINNFNLEDYSKYLDKFLKELDKPNKDEGKFIVIFHDSVHLLNFAYTYCFTEHNFSVINLLEQLTYLERTCTDYNARKLTKYWIDVEKDHQKKPRSKGGQIRAEKYALQRQQVYKSWESGKFHSYASCAKKLSLELNLAVKTIEKWLSEKYS